MRLIFILFFIPIAAFAQRDCSNTPELNQKIVKLASEQESKKVGKGECWDLVQLVLDESNADWDGYEDFGDLINHKKDCIYPGDIIQFENVKIEWEDGKYTYVETMKHHFAVVHDVQEDGTIMLIHQNTGQHGRKVGKTIFRIANMEKGKIFVFRPKAKSN